MSWSTSVADIIIDTVRARHSTRTSAALYCAVVSACLLLVWLHAWSLLVLGRVHALHADRRRHHNQRAVLSHVWLEQAAPQSAPQFYAV